MIGDSIPGEFGYSSLNSFSLWKFTSTFFSLVYKELSVTLFNELYAP